MGCKGPLYLASRTNCQVTAVHLLLVFLVKYNVRMEDEGWGMRTLRMAGTDWRPGEVEGGPQSPPSLLSPAAGLSLYRWAQRINRQLTTKETLPRNYSGNWFYYSHLFLSVDSEILEIDNKYAICNIQQNFNAFTEPNVHLASLPVLKRHLVKVLSFFSPTRALGLLISLCLSQISCLRSQVCSEALLL